MLPLSATLASSAIFEAFQDESKLKALLHGHSYTAHAIGCSAAVTALDLYTDPNSNPNYTASSEHTAMPCIQQLWDHQLVDQLSRHDRVQKLVAIGMLLFFYIAFLQIHVSSVLLTAAKHMTELPVRALHMTKAFMCKAYCCRHSCKVLETTPTSSSGEFFCHAYRLVCTSALYV